MSCFHSCFVIINCCRRLTSIAMSSSPPPSTSSPSPDSSAFASGLFAQDQDHSLTAQRMLAAAATAPGHCEGSQCVGVSAFGIPCTRRIGYDSHGFRHQRGYCCTVHYSDHVKCDTCNAMMHDGCLFVVDGEVRIPSSPWKCTKCEESVTSQYFLLMASQQAQTADAAASLASDVIVKDEDLPPPTTVVVYSNEAALFKAAAKHGWNRQSRSTSGTIYFTCRKTGCNARHSAKAKDESFHVKGPFPQNACFAVAPNPLMDGYHDCVATLDSETYSTIRQLACTGVFTSHLIAKHILISTKLIIDTTLIFNIGYRVRAKLFGNHTDTTYLLEQQKVYTSRTPCFYILFVC